MPTQQRVRQACDRCDYLTHNTPCYHHRGLDRLGFSPQAAGKISTMSPALATVLGSWGSDAHSETVGGHPQLATPQSVGAKGHVTEEHDEVFPSSVGPRLPPSEATVSLYSQSGARLGTRRPAAPRRARIAARLAEQQAEVPLPAHQAMAARLRRRAIETGLHKGGNLLGALQAYDPDGSGRVTRDGLRAALAHTGVPYSEKEVGVLFSSCDPGADGRVSYSRFVDELRRQEAREEPATTLLLESPAVDELGSSPSGRKRDKSYWRALKGSSGPAHSFLAHISNETPDDVLNLYGAPSPLKRPPGRVPRHLQSSTWTWRAMGGGDTAMAPLVPGIQDGAHGEDKDMDDDASGSWAASSSVSGHRKGEGLLRPRTQDSSAVRMHMKWVDGIGSRLDGVDSASSGQSGSVESSYAGTRHRMTRAEAQKARALVANKLLTRVVAGIEQRARQKASSLGGSSGAPQDIDGVGRRVSAGLASGIDDLSASLRDSCSRGDGLLSVPELQEALGSCGIQLSEADVDRLGMASKAMFGDHIRADTFVEAVQRHRSALGTDGEHVASIVPEGATHDVMTDVLGRAAHHRGRGVMAPAKQVVGAAFDEAGPIVPTYREIEAAPLTDPHGRPLQTRGRGKHGPYSHLPPSGPISEVGRDPVVDASPLKRTRRDPLAEYVRDKLRRTLPSQDAVARRVLAHAMKRQDFDCDGRVNEAELRRALSVVAGGFEASDVAAIFRAVQDATLAASPQASGNLAPFQNGGVLNLADIASWVTDAAPAEAGRSVAALAPAPPRPPSPGARERAARAKQASRLSVSGRDSWATSTRFEAFQADWVAKHGAAAAKELALDAETRQPASASWTSANPKPFQVVHPREGAPPPPSATS